MRACVHVYLQVETIGDAYMVVGGLPETCDDHASRIANMAMDMMHATSKVKRPDQPKESIHVRFLIWSSIRFKAQLTAVVC